MGGEWNHGLFGCFGNCGVCIMTMFCPCLTVGKIAEGLGDSYCYNCLCSLVPIVDLFIFISQRGRLREKQGIDGGLCGDLLTLLFCTPCGLCQMGAEVESMRGGMALDTEPMELEIIERA